jgi:hypothetical protein
LKFNKMAKVRMTKINNQEKWFNFYEDEAADDLEDTDLPVLDTIDIFTSGKSYTIWKTAQWKTVMDWKSE